MTGIFGLRSMLELMPEYTCHYFIITFFLTLKALMDWLVFMFVFINICFWWIALKLIYISNPQTFRYPGFLTQLLLLENILFIIIGNAFVIPFNNLRFA